MVYKFRLLSDEIDDFRRDIVMKAFAKLIASDFGS